jgi:starch phosphorylase
MYLTENLVQGVDVWLNTPRRPWEASGTSGMKVLVNGGINLSELDGWWAEAYNPEVGWALGDVQEHGDDPAWDAAEAEALYDLLEKQVVPEFYARNQNGISERWVARMRKSMATLTPYFSANRTVREYTEQYYLPAAENYIERAAEKGAAGKRIVEVKQDLRNKWQKVHFGGVQIVTIENGYLFYVHLFLNDINPANVLVELYAEGMNGKAPEKIKMETDQTGDNEENKYHAQVNTSRPAGDYTARVVPFYKHTSIPLEDNLILWHH